MFVVPLSHSIDRDVVHHRAIDRLFDQTFDRLRGGRTDTGARTPSMDVVETDDSYVVSFDVPGATKEQLEISVEGRKLSFTTSETPVAEAKTGERTLYRERAAARYARTVILPAELDQAASQAQFTNGVLTLTLKKKVPTGASRIQVS